MFNETSFCFINSHLAAGVSHWDRRNQNASDITAGIRIGRRPFEATEQFDHTFWCGRTTDCKYRRSTKCLVRAVGPQQPIRLVRSCHPLAALRLARLRVTLQS